MSGFATSPGTILGREQIERGLPPNAIGGTSKVLPIIERLTQLRRRLYALSSHLGFFETKLAGGPSEPQHNGSVQKADGEPAFSLEDQLASIEQTIVDIELTLQRITTRF